MTAIWLMIKDALTSKKFVAAIAGSITGGLLKIGLDLPAETVALVLSPVIAYILGQGWADSGKEQAKMEAIVSVIEGSQKSDAAKVAAIKVA